MGFTPEPVEDHTQLEALLGTAEIVTYLKQTAKIADDLAALEAAQTLTLRTEA